MAFGFDDSNSRPSHKVYRLNELDELSLLAYIEEQEVHDHVRHENRTK